MDRLHTLTLTLSLALLVVGACDEAQSSSDSAAKAPPARFAAVTKRPSISEKDLNGFCDVRPGTKLKLPPLLDHAKEPEARWVNIWATWCKSCVEEVPMIEKWTSALSSPVLYVSADEEREVLQDFLKTHPSFPETKMLRDPDKVSDWMASLGLDDGAGLPLHLFLNRDGELLCARAGAVQAHHRALVAQLLK